MIRIILIIVTVIVILVAGYSGFHIIVIIELLPDLGLVSNQR